MSRKRRGNGEGSICRRSDGRWMARITVGYTATGKRTIRTIYGRTKREVQEKLAVLQHQKATGTLSDASKMTVAEWLTHWVENIARPKLGPATYEEYCRTIRLHLIPRIGGVRLAKLSPINLQAMYSAMRNDGASDHKQLRAHAVLRASLNAAVKQGQIPVNACSRVDPPKYIAPEMTTLTSEQAVALVAASEGDRLHALIVLALTTGLRQGELFGLYWEDIDLKAGVLSVRRTLVNLNGQLSFRPPKTKSSIRTVKLPTVAIEALHDHRVAMMREGHAAVTLVFCGPQGGPLRRSDFVRYSFKPLLKRTGVPDIRFHDLRHTSATLMLKSNVHPKIVQQRLGHSKINMTLDTYSHVLPAMDEAAAETFDRLLKRKA